MGYNRSGHRRMKKKRAFRKEMERIVKKLEKADAKPAAEGGEPKK